MKPKMASAFKTIVGYRVGDFKASLTLATSKWNMLVLVNHSYPL